MARNYLPTDPPRGEQGDQAGGEFGKDQRESPTNEDERDDRDTRSSDGADGKAGVVEHRLFLLLLLKFGLEGFDLLLQALDAGVYILLTDGFVKPLVDIGAMFSEQVGILSHRIHALFDTCDVGTDLVLRQILVAADRLPFSLC